MMNSTLTLPRLELNPAELSQKDRYKLLIGCITPRPVAFVSTKSAEGISNLSPFSFFNAIASDPLTLMISTTVRGSDGAKKDTLLNIEATGEFVVNVLTEDIVHQANQSSAEYGRGVNEFTEVGLTEAPSQLVKPSRVLESPINMECKVYKLVPVGDGGPGSSVVVIGEIVYFHVREDVYENGRILIEKVKPVSRLAGSAYAPVHDIFEIPRPV